jgi:Ca2+/Na+ antiporter
MTLDSEPTPKDEPPQDTEADAQRQTDASDQQISLAAAKLEVPPPESQCCCSNHKQKHWIDYLTAFLELVGLVVLCLYAAYTIKIYYANQQAADSAKKTATEIQRQMRIDERPWLKIATFGEPGIQMPGKILVGQPLKIPFEIKNLGKTAARQVQAGFLIQITPNGESPHIKGVKPSDIFETGVIYPTASLKKQAVRVKMNSSGSVTVDLIMPEELREIRTGAAHVTFSGKVWYSDIFGVSHWTQFCAQFFVASTDSECSEFNDVDQNDDPDQTGQTIQ